MAYPGGVLIPCACSKSLQFFGKRACSLRCLLREWTSRSHWGPSRLLPSSRHHHEATFRRRRQTGLRTLHPAFACSSSRPRAGRALARLDGSVFICCLQSQL